MVNSSWGLLGLESLSSARRTRSLGVGAAVRIFNDLAVPGMGNVWFGKQLFLATLGVAVVDLARSNGTQLQNIEVANAIEAMACWLALKDNGWKSDPRLRGAEKMKGERKVPSFKYARKREFYVTQPMRMATVQPLPALGVVETAGSRFNAFTCSRYGHDFIEAMCIDYKDIIEHLRGWVRGDAVKVAKLRTVLSPLEQMPKGAREFLKERLIQGGIQESDTNKGRRRAALAWVESLREHPTQELAWRSKPLVIDDAHWSDLHAGARFFIARDAAIRVLDRLETCVDNQAEQRFSLVDRIPKDIREAINSLRVCADTFLQIQHRNELANAFCEECRDLDDLRLLAKLVGRDNHGLRIQDHIILPGPAFRGETKSGQSQMEEEGGESVQGAIKWPEGISYRIQNLFLLNLDLHGELSEWLGAATVSAAGEEE
ncbi:MAG: hypothetical protein OEV28_00785 [Nitrospirota bacterium]|nr:hypothetical protein [Nitrospirota bacterium]